MSKSRLPIALSLLLSSALTATASEVRVWGEKAEIAKYDPTLAILTVPPELAGKTVIDVRARQQLAVALTADRRIYAWGAPSLAEKVFTIPAEVQGHAIQMRILLNSAIALLDSGKIVAWGFDSQIAGVPNESTLTNIGDAVFGGVAWTNSGAITVWGMDAQSAPSGTLVKDAIGLRDWVLYRRLEDNQVLGFGRKLEFQSLLPPTPAITAKSISVGAALDVAFAIRPDDTLVAWGDNAAGVTTVPAGLSGVTAVAGGNFHALARTQGGQLTTWGSGAAGGLAVPADLTKVRLIAAGRGFSVAVVSQPPTSITWADSAQVIASAPVGTVIGRLTSVDPDPGDTVTYERASGTGDTDNAKVTIVGNEVRVAGVLPPGPGTLSLRVRGVDDSGASSEASLTVTLTAAPKPPASDSKSSSKCGLGVGTGLLLSLLLGWMQRRRDGRS